MIFNSKFEKSVFYDFPTILFSLLPIFLITGPFLSDLSISIISLLFLTFCSIKKNFSYFKNKYFYFFLIFWFYLIINSLIIDFNLDSLKISFFFFRYGVFVIAITAFLIFDNKFIKYFFYSIFLCFSVLIFDGFFQYFAGENILGYKSPSAFRVSSLFGDEMILGSYISRLWPIFFGLSIFFYKKKNKSLFILILIFILSEVLIFLSGERVAFFYINLSALFVMFFSSNLLKLRLFTLLSSLLIIIVISFFNPTAKERIIDNTLKQTNLLSILENKNPEVYIFSQEHTHHYITAYRIFLDNKILGVGVKNFRKFCGDKKYEESKSSCSTHPHNTYIQILTETGIIGFTFIIFVLFFFVKYLIKHCIYKFRGKKFFSDFEICLLSGLLIFLWPFAPTGNAFNNWLIIITILYLPFLIKGRVIILSDEIKSKKINKTLKKSKSRKKSRKKLGKNIKKKNKKSKQIKKTRKT
jgi:O-antigen ligase